jgi:hypothetical protein
MAMNIVFSPDYKGQIVVSYCLLLEARKAVEQQVFNLDRCLRHRSAGSQRSGLDQRDRKSDRRMDCAPDNRGISLPQQFVPSCKKLLMSVAGKSTPIRPHVRSGSKADMPL